MFGNARVAICTMTKRDKREYVTDIARATLTASSVTDSLMYVSELVRARWLCRLLMAIAVIRSLVLPCLLRIRLSRFFIAQIATRLFKTIIKLILRLLEGILNL